MKKLLIASILFITASSRLLFITQIPPLKSDTDIAGRVISALASILAVWCIYKITTYYTGKNRIGYLTALIFSVLPWTVEQGRIVSEVNMTLSITLFILWIQIFFSKKTKVIFFAILVTVFYFTYKEIWILHVDTQTMVSPENIGKNMLFLSSSEFLISHNPTFWWGGVRDWGISLSIFLPFLVIGIIKSIARKEIVILITIIMLLIFASSSPAFPESREFYLATPLISYFIAVGINVLREIKGKPYVYKMLTVIIVGLFIYEYQNFLHFYTVHYPLRVKSDIQKIIGPY